MRMRKNDRNKSKIKQDYTLLSAQASPSSFLSLMLNWGPSLALILTHTHRLTVLFLSMSLHSVSEFTQWESIDQRPSNFPKHANTHSRATHSRARVVQSLNTVSLEEQRRRKKSGGLPCLCEYSSFARLEGLVSPKTKDRILSGAHE